VETTNQRKEFKPMLTRGKYYRNNESKEKGHQKILSFFIDISFLLFFFFFFFVLNLVHDFNLVHVTKQRQGIKNTNETR
jgi:hypothetical protein